MLPWLNSYRFFLGQVSLLKKESNIDFTWDPKAKLSANVMDRWVLARCQSLIQSVKKEMEGAPLVVSLGKLCETDLCVAQPTASTPSFLRCLTSSTSSPTGTFDSIEDD